MGTDGRAPLPDAGPAEIGDCSDLGAPYEWQSINPPAGSFTGAIALDPFEHGTLWLSVMGQGIFKSTDCGSSWVHINEGRSGARLDDSLATMVTMIADPSARGVLYVVPYWIGNLYKSTDGGENWDPLFGEDSELAALMPSRWLQSASMDPTDPQHLLATSHDNCGAPIDGGCMMETFDGGETWTIVAIPRRTDWLENAGAIPFGRDVWVFGWNDAMWVSRDHGVDPNGSWDRVTVGGSAVGLFGAPMNIARRASDGHFYWGTQFHGLIRSPDGIDWEKVEGYDGRIVGVVTSGTRIFTTDQWHADSYRVAEVSNLAGWTRIPPPATLPADQGAPFIAYDPAHRILYSSNFAGGAWRVVIPE